MNVFLVIADITARDGEWGNTSSVVGVFSTEENAIKAKKDFIDELMVSKKWDNSRRKHCEKSCEIIPMVIDEHEEKIISCNYE